MKAEERRAIIAQTLTADRPISATALAGRFSVSRQIIVGDIALLRAAGLDIVATPRGYKLGETTGLIRAVACLHTAGADRGGTADHGGPRLHRHRRGGGPPHLWAAHRPAEPGLPVRCGAVCGEDSGDRPLSALTGGVHLHHLRCPDEEAYRRVCQELDRLGVLYTQNRGNWGLTRP